MAKHKAKTKVKYPERSKDVPLTMGVFDEFHQESHAKFSEVLSRIDTLGHQMDARFHELKILMEEQNARNKIVMDGLTSLFDRQDRLEKQLTN